jgi:hypothetical protein
MVMPRERHPISLASHARRGARKAFSRMLQAAK